MPMARTIVDDDLLTQLLAEHGGKQAGGVVGSAAGRLRND
jgi:hypothetical protein